MSDPFENTETSRYGPVCYTNRNAQLRVYKLAHVDGERAGYRPDAQHLREALHDGPRKNTGQQTREQRREWSAQLQDLSASPVQARAERRIDGNHLGPHVSFFCDTPPCFLMFLGLLKDGCREAADVQDGLDSA